MIKKICLMLALSLVVGCTQFTRLPTGEVVKHTNQWGESNRTIHVYGMGRVPYRDRTFKVWKTYTWNGSSYVCTAACMGSEAPIRRFNWPTPRYTDPYIRTMDEERRAYQNTVPLAPNRTIFGIMESSEQPFIRRQDQLPDAPENVIPLVPNTPINQTPPSAYTLPD